MNYVIGIDIGFSGAIAVVGADSRSVSQIVDMPIIVLGKKKKPELDIKAIKAIFTSWPVICVYVEKAQAMPKQGCVSMFRYGKTAGIIEGLLSGLDLPYTLITPQTWKKAMMDGMGKEKGASILRVNQLFPDADIGRRKKDHGKADAILIAEYGRKYLK